MNSNGVCEGCRSGTNLEHLAPIGESVVITIPISVGNIETEHSFSQCTNCGSVWVKMVDGGTGGHKKFYRRLTLGLF